MITLDRKPVFDAFRDILGRGFTPDEVKRIDAAINRAQGAAPPAQSAHVLGSLSEEFESGGRGPGTVSGGQNDPGGVSYGLWQIASKTGTASAFMAAEGAPWRSEFGGAVPGTTSFSSTWKTISQREPERFTEAQRAFIERTHYRPAVDAVKKRTGLDLDARHDAVRDATWSVAVQHGGAASILTAAVVKTDSAAKRDAPDYDHVLIDKIYDERTAYVLGVAAKSGLASPTGRVLVSITRSRYPAERAKAMEMLA